VDAACVTLLPTPLYSGEIVAPSGRSDRGRKRPFRLINRTHEHQSGGLRLRFYAHRTIAALMALRAGIQDAQGESFMGSYETQRAACSYFVRVGEPHSNALPPRGGFRRAIMFRFICQIELLFTATLLTLILVCFLAGAVQSLARFFCSPR
jgi:hypothetical protein